MAMISYDNCGHVVDGTHLCARCCAGQQIVAYPHIEALQEPHSQHNTTQHNNSTTIQLTTNSIADLVYNRRSFVTATTQLKSTQLVHSAGHLSNCFIITHRKAFLFFFFFTLLYTIFFFAVHIVKTSLGLLFLGSAVGDAVCHYHHLGPQICITMALKFKL